MLTFIVVYGFYFVCFRLVQDAVLELPEDVGVSSVCIYIYIYVCVYLIFVFCCCFVLNHTTVFQLYHGRDMMYEMRMR